MKVIRNVSMVMLCTMLICLFFSSGQEVSAETSTEYLKINNTTLEFNDIIYVDGTNGDDTNGDGSSENAYKSITKAQSVAVDGNAIYIKAGTYEEGTWAGIYEDKHKLTFIGEPNKTIIVSDGTKQTTRDIHAAVFETDCSAYNLIFQYTAGNRNVNYSRALVGSGNMSTQQYGKFYNCVFIATDKAPAPCYGNGNINVEFNNCSFIIPDNFLSTYIRYGTDKTKWINCAVNKNVYTTGTTCLGNVEFSTTDYNIISDGWKNTGTGTNPDGSVANLGVYGGEFAWNSTGNEIPSSPTNLVANGGNSQVILAWDAVDEAESYNIKRSTTSGGSYETIGAVTGSAIAFTDTDVTNGTTYYYVVSAVVSGTEGSDSSEASATPKDTTVIKKLKVVLEVKEELQLSVSDDLSDNVDLTWTSSDSTVASVDNNGYVTALKPGNTVITASNDDGTYSESINILVVENADDYRLAVDLKVGKSCRLTVDDLTETVGVTWDSSDESVATISGKGKVTAVSEGLTLITATDDEGNIIGTIYVRVRE